MTLVDICSCGAPLSMLPADHDCQALNLDDRETIARIIDPRKWEVLDGYLADMLRKYAGQNIGYDPESFKDKASLAKADAILALRTKEPSRG